MKFCELGRKNGYNFICTCFFIFFQFYGDREKNGYRYHESFEWLERESRELENRIIKTISVLLESLSSWIAVEYAFRVVVTMKKNAIIITK